MILEGCHGRPKTPEIIEKICPQCGHEIEMFTIDTEMKCDNCGFTVYNDSLSCVQWCKYARKCVGDDMYETLIKIGERSRDKVRASAQLTK